MVGVDAEHMFKVAAVKDQQPVETFAAERSEYQRDLERHALQFFGRIRLAEIEPRDIKRFIATLINQGTV